MALRYLVASGNWSSTSIWSSTEGGSPGASAPTISDDARLYADRTVTLDTNAEVNSIEVGSSTYNPVFNINQYDFSVNPQNPFNMQRGTLNLTTGTLTVRVTQFGNSTTKTLNLGSGTVNFISYFTAQPKGIFKGTGLVVNSDKSTIEINRTNNANNGTFDGGGHSFNNVTINHLGTGYTEIINSSSFKTFSTSGAANIKFRTGTTQSIRKLVLPETSVKTINTTTSGVKATIAIVGSNQLVAADYIDVKDITITGTGVRYAGSSSTDSGNNTGWTFADAPLITTFQDDFSSGSLNTTKWTASTASGGSVVQSGGKLSFFATSGASFASVISKDQYLLEGSEVFFKAIVGNPSGGGATIYVALSSNQYGITSNTNIPTLYIEFIGSDADIYLTARSTASYSHSVTSDDVYWKVREESGTIYVDSSPNGIGYTNITSFTASSVGLDTTQMLARPYFILNPVSITNSLEIDDFNISLAPTAEFVGTPLSGATPLTVNFTDLSNFDPDTWSWTFGDSGSSAVQNPSHEYTAAGTYTVALQASNVDDDETATKVGYITVNPNVFARTATGTLTLGGGATRTLLASRSATGTLLLGGSVSGFVLRDSTAIETKTYLYKVYDEEGNYIEIWSDVISDPVFTHEINEVGSVMDVELARNSDSISVSVENIQAEDGATITTESSIPLQASVTSRNQVGPGSSVNHNNRVDVFVFYGSVEPLQAESGEEITTEDGEVILAVLGAPNGRRIFTGFISEINSRYGSTETTQVQLMSYGFDLSNYAIESSGDTRVTYNSQDPSAIARDAIDKFIAQSAGDFTYTTRTDISILDTSSVVSYTFNVNSYQEVLKKTLELMPADWYFRVGLGDNVVYYRERSETPQHTFFLGKHIKTLELKSYIGDVVNDVLYVGGGDPALYRRTTEAKASRVRRGLSIEADSRVTVDASADIIADSIIAQKNKIQYRSTIEILDKQYDIESINVGDMVGFRNFGSYVDELMLQVVALTYTPDFIQLQLDSKAPTVNKRLEDIRRNLNTVESVNTPNAPA